MAGLAVVVRAKKQLLKRAVQQPRIPPWSNAPTSITGLESYEESHEEGAASEEAYERSHEEGAAYEEAYERSHEDGLHEEDHEEALE
jgi:hypothetical protein